MSVQATSPLRLEIGHVLFIDIVGYSTLLINEQSDLLAELNDVVRGTEHFRSAEAEGKLVRLPMGDGMALVFHNSPEEPARCALEISQSLKNYPNLRVRMGIHSGPVNEVADVNERANIAGAGINIAQRVMDCGGAGHILLSKRVAEADGIQDDILTNLSKIGDLKVISRMSVMSYRGGLIPAGSRSGWTRYNGSGLVIVAAAEVC